MSRDYSKRPDVPKERFFEYVKGKKIRRNTWNTHIGYFIPETGVARGLHGQQYVGERPSAKGSWHPLEGFDATSGGTYWELVDPVETPKALVLREGGYYKNGLGEVVGPLRRTFDTNYPFVDQDLSYMVDGRYSRAGASEHLDLIEEVLAPESTPTMATGRAEFQRQAEEEICRPGSTFKVPVKENKMWDEFVGFKRVGNKWKVVENTKKEKNMKEKIVAKAQQIRETIRPYDNYLLAVAALIVIDHFLLKGKYRDKILQLVTRLADRCSAMLDKLIDKIGG
jgi:hypothetical protein